jgi:translation initiation factor 3 subunit F
MSAKAYVSAGLTLGEAQLGTVFRDIRLTVVNGESDRVGIDNLVKMTSMGAAGAAPGGGSAELDSVESTVKKLLRTLDGVVEYVDKVVKGNQTAEPEVVRLLQQLVAAAPRLPTESFEKMFNTQVQDMLTIVYLANLTRTQLALAEKLQAVALTSSSN